jgi:hypothetical protein
MGGLSVGHLTVVAEIDKRASLKTPLTLLFGEGEGVEVVKPRVFRDTHNLPKSK